MLVITHIILYYIFDISDLNLILTRLDKSKESVLNAAEQCYLRALALETNINNKTFLNRRIGIVYNKYAEFYLGEIISKLKCNLKSINYSFLDFFFKLLNIVFLYSCHTK